MLKVNNYRNWDVSTDIGYHKEWYVPIEAQRNYAKDHAVSREAHLKSDDKKIVVAGWGAKYTVKTDKFFILF